MRIIFAWPGISGFYGPCWHFLQNERGAKLKCVCAVNSGADASRAYDLGKCFDGIDVVFTPRDDSFDADGLRKAILEFAPDIMFVVGWSIPVNRFLATDSAFSDISKVFCFDMPWQLRLRKFAARFVLAKYLSHFSAAFVAGESAARYARWLGFGKSRPVFTGQLPVDSSFYVKQPCRCRREPGETGGACCLSSHQNAGSFLYVGRYAHEKGTDILAEAYRMYRARVGNPWGLYCAGAGEQAKCLADIPGVTDLGFTQPSELPAVYASHRVFILPSRSESWGVAMAEAAAGGLPVICTDACGGRFDLVRDSGDMRNGFVASAGSAASLADAMVKMHQLKETELSQMSEISRKLAEPYSVPRWADRVLRIVKDISGADSVSRQ